MSRLTGTDPVNRCGPLAAAMLIAALPGLALAQAESLQEAFSDGEVSGNLRAYHNIRDAHGSDANHTFALGGSLHAETAPWSGVSAGATFYTSNGLGLQYEERSRRNANLPDDVDVLGEAWMQYEGAGNRLRAGRLKVDTPFSNPSDAFLIPITYEALSVANTAIDGLELSGHYLRRIKNRPDDAFERIGQFALDRYGVVDDSDKGAWIAGARYQPAERQWQAWAMALPDLFTLYYVRMDTPLADWRGLAFDLGVQGLYGDDAGDALADRINARGGGLQLSLSRNATTLALAWNRFWEDADAYGRGALPMPFSYSTGPLFTNSMTQTLENSAAGQAYKISLKQSFSPRWSGQVSYARYQRLGAVDTDEADLDISYAFGGGLEGLSLRLRVGVIGSDQADARFVEVRPQLQYVF
ncbi:OprD family outer membrane porin [Alcanivorax sp. 24]|uniref:OprD family outer membrane porin n=1 Tax=Alcanivorax sp. 24 TaxID=2545266 RepID=UPI00105C1AE6|nr:OprD family outer membrane porin [Alcanivorax sp. 24]